MSTLGERLTLALRVRGISARELDRRLGRNRYADKITRDARSGKIEADSAQAIAEALHIDPTWLVTGEGTAPAADDDLTQVRATPKPAPFWRLDPAWEAQHALALTHRPDALPPQYIDELAGHVVPGRRPTWPLILEMAKVYWHADLAEAARHGGPSSGVSVPAQRVESSEDPVAPAQSTRRR